MRVNSNKRDLTGQKFGRWTVIEMAEPVYSCGKPIHRWLCQCECGTMRIVREGSLIAGTSKSCGCYHKDIMHEVGKQNTKHGLTDTKIYRAYKHMMHRCYDPSDKNYSNYGGRGITVCEDWRNSFESFAQWSFENGFKQDVYGSGCSIDRIDVNGNYEPLNCRWVDSYVQANNRRMCKFYTYKGETHTIAEWSKMYGIPYERLRKRLVNYEWDIETALTRPPMN